MTALINVVSVKLVREESALNPGRKAILQADDAAKLAREFIGEPDREHLVMLLLDVKNRVNAIHLVSVGTLTSTLVEPREVFKAAILANAAGVILAHNHPSGDETPSYDDIAITNRIAEAGKLLGIPLLDHIVLGDKRHASLQALGYVR